MQLPDRLTAIVRLAILRLRNEYGPFLEIDIILREIGGFLSSQRN